MTVVCGDPDVAPGEFAGENDGSGEQMHVLCGDATVTSEDDATVELGPGVAFVARAGWRGNWDVPETVRKIYVIWRMPWPPLNSVHFYTDPHQRIVLGQLSARPSLPVNSGRSLVARVASPQQQAKSLVPASAQQHIDRCWLGQVAPPSLRLGPTRRDHQAVEGAAYCTGSSKARLDTLPRTRRATSDLSTAP